MKHTKIIAWVLSILFIVVLWELIAYKIDFPAFFPSLKDLFKEIADLFSSKEFYTALGSTVFRGLIGLLASFILAFLFATLAAFSVFWKTFFQPLIVILRSIPVISFVLLALIWFSPEQLPVFIALLTVFPISYQNILTALTQTDHKLVEMATVFGKTSLQRFFGIYLPSAKNMILDGVATAMGFAWRAIIIGEALAQPQYGIGTAMKTAQAYIQVPRVLAWTLAAILVSYFFDILLLLIRKIKFRKDYVSDISIEPENVFQRNTAERVQILNLYKKYGESIIFEGYNDCFDNAAVHALKGESGRGKTTLLRIISGLDKSYQGEVIYSPEASFSYSFQDVRLLPWLTVKQNIIYVIHKRYVDKQTVEGVANYLLEKFSLSDHSHKYPHQLSGGQQQRVGLVRALAFHPSVLLMDEPLNGLDMDLKKQVMDFIFEWFEISQPLIIWATHEEFPDNKIGVVATHNI